MRYEIFISYSRKDNVRLTPDDEKGWVEAFRDAIIAEHRSITTDPLEICLYHDLREIESFDDWQRNILTGLRESRILLVCLSPNYFNSPPCLWEWEEYQKRQVHAQVGQDSVAPVYFVEVPGSDKAMTDAWVEAIRRGSFSEDQHGEWKERWQAWHKATMGSPNYVDLKPWFPLGAQALREKTIREQMQTLASARTSLDQQLHNLGTALWSRIERVRRAEASPQNPELRRRNRHFIGRHKELGQLHEATHTGAIGLVTVVHGLGGQGKTELVSAYAHEHAYSYPAGRWYLRAEGKRELIPLLADLRDTLELPRFPEETAINTGFRVLSELKRRSTEAAPRDPDGRPACLLILDNVSEASLLAEPQLDLLPEELWLHVIATTRLAPDSFAASPEKTITFLPLDPLTLDDAARLLEEHQPGSQWPAATAKEDAAAARELARELGGFALAVESVAIHLGIHREIRPADYLTRLRAAGLPSVDALPDDSRIGDRIRHQEKQLSLILDTTLQAANLTPLERAVLDYASLLPPDSIPWDWLKSLVSEEFKAALVCEPGWPDPWENTRRRLLGLRLLTSGDTTGVITRMHRMFSAEFRTRMEEAGREKLGQNIGKLIVERAIGLRRTTNWTLARWEIEAFEAMARLLDEWEHGNAGVLLNQAGLLWSELAEWGKAEALYRRALELEENACGKDAPRVADCLSNLSALLLETNRLADAEPLARRALAINEAHFGDSHANVGTTLNGLGRLLEKSNQLVEAERVLRRSLAICEANFGDSHTDVASILTNIASVMLAEQRYAEAEPLVRRALTIDEAGLGDSHPKVAQHLNNLATLMHFTERFAEAEPLLWRVLAIDEVNLGTTHPKVALRLSNLAALMTSTKRFTEAEPLLRRALAIDEASFGESHSDVARVLNNLACVLQETDRLPEAELLMRRAIAIDEAVLGDSHPMVVHLLFNLARWLEAANRSAEAEPLLRRIVEISVKQSHALGHPHPLLDIAMTNYGNLLMEMGATHAEADAKIRSIVNSGDATFTITSHERASEP